MLLEMCMVFREVFTSLHAFPDLMLLSFSLLWCTRMHPDMLIEVTSVVTFVLTLLTIMDLFLLLFLS